MINKISKLVLFTFLVLLFSTQSKATHMVGGDFTYRCLGEGYFEITLTIRRDCEYGADDAFFDDKAHIAVFNQYGQIIKKVGLRGGFKLPYVGNDTLNESLIMECGIMGDPVCVHEAIYRDTIYLPEPPVNQKYVLVYQRCCRNQTLLNINNPLETGGSYVIEIDKKDWEVCNSSPVFKNWPAIYVCGGQPLVFDHSATEPDGDSLVYELYTPYSGATITYPMPTVADPGKYTPFYKKISWSDNYSVDNILGGNDPLKIDPVTGIITGTPEKTGQFLVGVMVKEYRNGILMSTVRRDFEYNVRPCVDPPVADFESLDAICGSGIHDTLVLTNTSLNADSYHWYIYQHSTGKTDTFTTTDLDFIYDLPASGKDTFDVSLDAYSSVANCSDNYQKSIIAVKDAMIADFDVTINDCYNDSLDITLNLKDKFEQLNPLYTWKESKWVLSFSNDTLFAEGKIVSIVVPKEGKTLIKLFISSEEKCTASVEKWVSLDFATIEFISNPMVVCKGDPTKFVANPHSEWTYTWQPETGLQFDGNDKSNPTFTGEQNSKYYVTVTDGICTAYDSVEMFVKDYFDISISGPDTVCTNSVELTALGADPSDTVVIFQWSDKNDFSNILSEEKTVTVNLNNKINKFYLRVKEGTGCSNNIDSITVYNGAINLQYDKEINYCTNNNSRIILTNLNPNSDVKVHWEDSPLIVKGQDSLVLIIYSQTTGEYNLVFHATTDFGCELTDTIHVTANEGPLLTLNNDLECDSYTMCFSVTGATLGTYEWDFGDPANQNDTSYTDLPCFDYKKPGVYHVAVEVLIEDCNGKAYLEKDIVVPEILDVTIDQNDITYCKGEQVTLIANKNAESTLEWFSNSTSLGVGDTLEFNPVGDMDVYVVGTDGYNCTDTAFVKLTEYKYDITYIDPGVRCKGDTVGLEIRINNGANLSFEWTGENIIEGANTNTPTVVVYETVDFNVKITDLDYGCDSTFVVSVTVSDLDIYVDADTTELVITNSTNITVNNVPPNSTINWNTGETNVETITITPSSADTGTKTYCVTVTDQYGCTDVDCIDIKIIDPACDESDIFIPNAFSPNSDGVNDLFRPRGRYIRSVDIQIFDRWGELIYEGSGDEFINWDGTFRGKNLPIDVYTYRVHVLCEDTDNWTKTGNVSIIK